MDNVLELLTMLGPPQSTAAMVPAAQNDSGMGGLLCSCAIPCVIFGVITLAMVAIGWKIFTKAGRPGWEAIVPIYNQWILVTEICKLEPLWFILALVPIGNIISAWKVSMELAKKFGKSDTFGIGLFLLGPIFAAILAFGDAKYQGAKKKRYDDDEDEEEDEEEEEEEERPRKKKRRDDDED